MVPLMERIAWQLCQRVTQVIDVHTLFKYVWTYSDSLRVTIFELVILLF